MGYTTDFEGYLEPNREFTNEEIALLGIAGISVLTLTAAIIIYKRKNES